MAATKYERWTLVGALVAAFGFPAAAVLLLLSVSSANACGMFGDGCDDYGKPAPGFTLLVGATVVVLAAAMCGLVVAVVAARRR